MTWIILAERFPRATEKHGIKLKVAEFGLSGGGQVQHGGGMMVGVRDSWDNSLFTLFTTLASCRPRSQ